MSEDPNSYHLLTWVWEVGWDSMWFCSISKLSAKREAKRLLVITLRDLQRAALGSTKLEGLLVNSWEDGGNQC